MPARRPDRTAATDRSARTEPAPPPERDRRAADQGVGLTTAWRRLKGLLKRPLRLERRGLQLHLVLLERRRNREPFHPGSDVRLMADLRARLLAIDHQHAATGMRQLLRVHDELRRKGWGGVEALSSRELRRALAQAELLSSLEPSASMTRLIERLRLHLTAALLREEHRARVAAQEQEQQEAVEVLETDFDAFAESQRAHLEAATRAAAAAGAHSD